MQCEIKMSGCEGSGEWRIDPFLAAVHEEQVQKIMCDACYQSLTDEI